MKLPLFLMAALAIATPAAARRAKPDAELSRALAGRVAGAPVSCIGLTGTTSTQVVDGRALIYRIGGRLYLNVPRDGADRLDDDSILVTRVTGSQLCRIDRVEFRDRLTGMYRGFAVLGDFVPYTKPPKGA